MSNIISDAPRPRTVPAEPACPSWCEVTPGEHLEAARDGSAFVHVRAWEVHGGGSIILSSAEAQPPCPEERPALIIDAPAAPLTFAETRALLGTLCEVVLAWDGGADLLQGQR